MRLLALSLIFLHLIPAVLAETNVILITADSLRADRLEPYGYEGVKTPAISRLAREGVTFERVIVQTPLGAPSYASILTGTYPQFHRLQNAVGYLSKDIPILAEYFQEEGYETGAFVGSGLLLSQWGFNRGFGTYDDHFSTSTSKPTDFDRLQRRAERVAGNASEWVKKIRGKPFFLWLQFSDPHEPYTPPAPYSEDYTATPYDGEIAYIDSVLSGFLDFLEKEDLYKSALIALTSPHGTALSEHGEMSHGLFLYQSTLHVPLILKLANGKLPVSEDQKRVTARVSGQVRSIDLAPTLIGLLSKKVPDSMHGESLIDHMRSPGARSDLPAYSETHFPNTEYGWSPLFSYSTGRYKFIQAPNPELYDLTKDPTELKDVYSQNRDLADQLEAKLKELQSRFPSQASWKENPINFPDPKERMESYWEMNEAISSFRDGFYEKGFATIGEVLQKEPTNPAAHFALGSAYLDQGNYLLAVQEFRESLKINSTSYEYLINLALAYLYSGLYGKAQQILVDTLESNPSDSIARQFLAISYAKQGNLDEAIVHGTIAVELRPLSASAHYNLGSYYLGKGEDLRAAECFRQVVEIAPAHVEGRVNLSLVLLRLSRSDEALKQAQEAVKLAPDYGLGYFYLSEAYRAKGMQSEAETAYRRAVELDPQLGPPEPGR